jgi:hypothetical protein
MATLGNVGGLNKTSLPLIDMDAELKKFEEEERKRLGLDTKTEHWIEDMAGLTFTKREKAKITMLVGGLTMAHDYFVEALDTTCKCSSVRPTRAFRWAKSSAIAGSVIPPILPWGTW